MVNYDELSDFEINKRVIEVVLNGSENPRFTKAFTAAKEPLTIASTVRVTFADDSITTANFCNNPSDAWPIIVNNRISIEYRDSLKLDPLAGIAVGRDCYWSDKNPLRAAMICFLKMKDAEQ